jgi:mono/diheme cytochrome c family protein
MAAKRIHGWVLFAVIAAAGCSKTVTEPLKLAGGKTVDVHTLQNGYEAYMLYCYGCHGAKGDGKGPASGGMRPPPRNFTQGLFKFAGTSAGQLPPDEALDRTIRRGLHGTPMLAWDIPEVERHAIIQYLKTFSPKWKEEEPGAPTEISADPWKGKDQEAIAKGKAVYHVAAENHAGCSGCHAAYASRQEISDMAKAITGEPIAEFAEEMYRTSLRETEYPLHTDEKGEMVKAVQQLPPDFLFHRVKTAYPVGVRVDGKPYTDEQQREDLYRTIGSGVGGAAMPTWKGSLSEENLWALVYYVQAVMAKRDSKEAYAMRQQLEAQPKWAPPPPPEPPAPEPQKGGAKGGSR